MSIAPGQTNVEPLIKTLQAVIGPDHVITDRAERTFYSTDVFFEGNPADVVVQPGSKEELARAVAEATRIGHAVVPRGGGMSYSAGYVPERQASMIVDTRRLNRIVEINAEDMYVTVECGHRRDRPHRRHDGSSRSLGAQGQRSATEPTRVLS